MRTNDQGVQIIPWESIRDGLVDYAGPLRTMDDSLASPCASCETSPCCTHLPLHTFTISNLLELDHARYLLNFDRIQLGLSAAGDWSVYYVYPCRFLDRNDLSCTVHNQPAQPQICTQYNPYNCWYQRVFTRSVSAEFLQVDRPRFEYIASQIEFDAFNQIVTTPDWATMVEALRDVTATPPPVNALPPEDDAVFAAWREAVRSGIEDRPGAGVFAYEDLTDPCTGCGAYCCETLVFPQSAPSMMSSLDFCRFALGFPGVELGIADEAWSLIVHTRCRHLEGGRCSVFGSPERPLICKYYDAWKCTYRPNFGRPRPDDFLRIRLEQWEWLTECFRFDEFGQVAGPVSVADIRPHIEARWHETLSAAAAPGPG